MIELKQVTKTYKVKKSQSFFKNLFRPVYQHIDAVKNVSFSIQDGELIGFIGPNGAGKTTTIKMLTGILWPTQGKIIINGKEPYKDRKNYLKHVGVVFGQRKSLWPELSVIDNLELIGSFYNMDKKQVLQRVRQLKEFIAIDEYINYPFRKLSLGQQMKAELVSALIHKPSIVYLDEPTIGMDIIAKNDFIELLKKINKKEKVTIILTSHDLHEIEKLCERILIINKGKLLYDGKTADVKPKSVVITYEKAGKITKKQVKKSEIKYIITKLKLEEFSVQEAPLEQVIKKFYK